jgi:hypothetical protein
MSRYRQAKVLAQTGQQHVLQHAPAHPPASRFPSPICPVTSVEPRD